MNGALRVVLCSLVAMLAAIPPAPAQEWPARPVTLVNLFGAGGVDFATRALAKALTEQRTPAAPGSDDPALRAEVRQLVIARNERRARQGKEPLDVEAEVDRQLRELENLGQ